MNELNMHLINLDEGERGQPGSRMALGRLRQLVTVRRVAALMSVTGLALFLIGLLDVVRFPRASFRFCYHLKGNLYRLCCYI